ncbi:RnfH family protein [Corticibacter populi]|uniref:RnfH family protein n=2 Tax=Corticibacter populi TaxID=1550736 RepID=A0A3M6QJB9_9BURK|nr:RnfH family protein [Corticibacter populi]RZS32976.1 hypothetical protein EV687_1290 [Corticibacter populi]
MLRIEVAVSLAGGGVWECVLACLPGTTLAQAVPLVAAQWADEAGAARSPLPLDQLRWGVWGRVLPPGHVLQPQDRLEGYRPLKVDPKVARRERFARQGARGAGLFAQRRGQSRPG